MASWIKIPISFHLTERATDFIHSWTREVATSEANRNLIPVIGWHDEYEESLRTFVDRGISFGWYDAEQVPANMVQYIDGIELVFNVASDRANKFENRTIDLIDGRLQFMK